MPVIVKLSDDTFVNLDNVVAVRFADGFASVYAAGETDDTCMTMDADGGEGTRLRAALDSLANDSRRLTYVGNAT